MDWVFGNTFLMEIEFKRQIKKIWIEIHKNIYTKNLFKTQFNQKLMNRSESFGQIILSKTLKNKW